MTRNERKQFCDHLIDISETANRKGQEAIATAVTLMATCLILFQEERVIEALDPIATETLSGVEKMIQEETDHKGASK